MTNNPPARFRHRTAEVEAVQWTGSNADQLRAFCGPDFDEIDPEDRTENPDASAAVRESKHGTWRGLEPGYWVVKIGEDFYEESAADFAAQFEPAVVSPPATNQAEVREQIADVLAAADGWKWAPGFKAESPTWQSYQDRADAVLAVLRGLTLRELEQLYRPNTPPSRPELRRMADEATVVPPPVLTEAGRLRAQVEVLQQDGERDRGLAKVGARCMREGHQGLIESGRSVIEGWRFALSTALNLGTGAPWEAIHERVKELTGQPAVEAQQQPDTETRDAEAHPPTHTWKVESPRRDKWASWGATHDERVWAAAGYEDVIGVAPQRPFRLVRATTTYVVEAEHTPEPASGPGGVADEEQPCSAALLPFGTAPADRCVVKGKHLEHATAEGRRWTTETVHGCPPDGSGLTPCCGRTPFELPLTDRISSEAPVTCKGAKS